ncbi:MAG: hypothetical protein J6T28_03865 [Paludibacteraceae bacterium]|nr:hypothetical protein [Paludibacteraceae bacterium]MBP5480697.1 hypothetical protein [Paludibacteraceae bacterium]
MIKRVAFIGIMVAGVFTNTLAQNNISSPYTRYGYGSIVEGGYGQSTQMGGLMAGLRSAYFTNPSNPASYTAIDSLNFRIEAGLSFSSEKYSDATKSQRCMSGNFEYLAMQFPVKRWMAVSIGIRPYSLVGYKNSRHVTESTDLTQDTLKSSYTYEGEGGINQLYFGVGFRPFKNLSVGGNLLYHFGTIEHNSAATFDDAYIYPTTQTQKIHVRDFCANVGLQGSFKFSKEQFLTIGATYQFKSVLKSEADRTIITSDTIVLNYDNNFDTPSSFGMGFVFHFNSKVLAGFDYKRTAWSDVRFFGEKPFEDVNRFAWGVQYQPGKSARRYFQRMYYRCGLNVSKSYYKVNGEGINQMAVDAGFGFPLKKGMNPTVINVGLEYGKRGNNDNGLVKEQYLKGTINVTLNERWFVKRKLE